MTAIDIPPTNTPPTTVRRPDWLTDRIWPYRVRSVDIDGTAVAYTDEGNGPTLLLVHDGMWSFIWGQLIERLRSDFRVVTLDFPGSGLSPAGDYRVDLHTDAELLDRFVAAVGLKTFTLVLHDLGGPVGFHLTKTRPDQVLGAVFMNTFVWPPHNAGLRVMFSVMTSGPVRSFNVATNLIPKLTTSGSGIGRHLDAADREAFLRGFDERFNRRRFHHLMTSVRNGSDVLVETDAVLRDGFGERPTLSIYGEKNDPFGFQRRISQYLPDTEEMVIDKGNHFPMCDDPDAVAERIADWHRRKLQ